MSPIFKGMVENGKLKLDNPFRYAVKLSLLNGKRIELVLRKEKKQRTNPQNAYYHAVIVKMLEERTGYSHDEMHEALKIQFASRPDPETGLVIVESTAKMTTVRFIEYCEEIQRWAIEFLALDIPGPNECDYREWTENNTFTKKERP